ncbi:MAG TPA: type II CAAX endopeptidase family protein [Candidatus Acidoferrales bacterium]|nr:type II CAAX endopeptidase family protein [Candidatus Acidoferrales bacterium]
MTTLPSPTLQPDDSGPVAPGWHTAMVLVFLAAFTGLSVWRGSLTPVGEVGSKARLASYATVLVWEWLMVGFIAWGIGKRGVRLWGLVAGRWTGPSSFFRDLGIAVVFLLGSSVVLQLVRFALRAETGRAVINLLPNSPLERAVWIALSATAGICEEIIFRGYLQQQLGRLTGSMRMGLTLQAVVFGACHLYQGWKSAITIAVFGLLFGLLAHYRKSLRPGMLAHFTQDTAAGLAGRWLLEHAPRS